MGAAARCPASAPQEGGGFERLLVGVLWDFPAQGCLVALIPSPYDVRVRPGGSRGISHAAVTSALGHRKSLVLKLLLKGIGFK